MPPKILIIGDSMLDVAHYGTVTRLSQEADIPILDVHETKYFAGGAANVMLNLNAMGADCILASNTGEDEEAKILRSIVGGVFRTTFRCESSRTTVKTRGFSPHGMLYRMDSNYMLTREEQDSIVTSVYDYVGAVDAVVLSDYGRGVLGRVRQIMKMFHKTPIYVDPKGVDWTRYAGARCIKANAMEIDEELETQQCDPGRLCDVVSADYIIETRGIHGAALHTSTGRQGYENPRPIQRGDPTGAGDTFFAQFVLSQVQGRSLEESVHRAQVAASIAVEFQGTRVVTADELEKALKELT